MLNFTFDTIDSFDFICHEVSMEKNIIKLLNLNPEDVESLELIRSSNGNCDYKLILKKRNHICPYFD